jgi:hypothetical protein
MGMRLRGAKLVRPGPDVNTVSPPSRPRDLAMTRGLGGTVRALPQPENHRRCRNRAGIPRVSMNLPQERGLQSAGGERLPIRVWTRQRFGRSDAPAG